MPRGRLLVFFSLAGLPAGAHAAELMPHRAVYDLALTSSLPGLSGGEGRIVIELRQAECDVFDVDYRFVASFKRDDRTVVTDQQTSTTEDLRGKIFEFRTETFVDDRPESLIEGRASSGSRSTRVDLDSPEPRSLDIALSVFPTAHLSDLIDKAKAGERLVETSLFDGDNEADKRLTTTAIISPMPLDAEGDGRELNSSDPRAPLGGLTAWKVHESYYNSDNDADGLPLFQSNYVLYENGVSDALTLDTGDYAFSGGLSTLELLEGPSCE